MDSSAPTEQVPIHFNSVGKADIVVNRFWLILSLPFSTLFIGNISEANQKEVTDLFLIVCLINKL